MSTFETQYCERKSYNLTLLFAVILILVCAGVAFVIVTSNPQVQATTACLNHLADVAKSCKK